MPRVLLPLLLVIATSPAWAEAPAPRVVDIAAPDGAILKGTYYAAAGPGPGVLLLHMCNANRQSWDQVGRQLSAAGIHALALDYRGYGDSPGAHFNDLPAPSGRSSQRRRGPATWTPRWRFSLRNVAWTRRGSVREAAAA